LDPEEIKPMPTPKSKRTIVLLSSATEYDASELAADGQLLVGGAGADRLAAEPFGPVSQRPFWIEGSAGADLLIGSFGDDLLIASRAIRGDDPRDGESDTDNAVGVRTDGRPGRPGDTLDGGGGNDLLFGSDADDHLNGGDNDDFLLGFDGEDTLLGGSGDDTLAGDFGSNTLNGGAGIDTASWATLVVQDRPRDSQGVALNLSTQTIRFGFGPVDFLVAPGTASHRDAAGFGVDTLHHLERFDGTTGDSDAAFLDASFQFAGIDAAGFTAYSDGTTTVFLRGFEDVAFA